MYRYYLYGDVPVIVKQNFISFIISVLIGAVLIILIYKLCLKFNKYDKKIIIPVILFIAFIIQLFVILILPRLPTDDSQTVLSLAMGILNQGDFSTFNKGGYLYMFPYNFSIVLYYVTLLSIFPNSYIVLKVFNILFSLVTTLIIYLIYKELNYKSNENENHYGILVFSVLYIPSILMSNFIYNDTIATAFFAATVFFVIKFIKEKSLKYLIIFSILLSIGNYFRNIGIILLIAISIYFLMNIKKIKFKKILVYFFIIVIIFYTPVWSTNIILQTTNIVDESIYKNSAPTYMWLNMGINDETFGFWDNFESYNIYQVQADYEKDKSLDLFKESISNKLSNMKISELVNMYYKKIMWTWTEGTFQIDRYGIGESSTDNGRGGMGMGMLLSGYSYETYFTELFEGDSVYRKILLWMLYIINFLIYCFILIRLIRCIKYKNFGEIFIVLIILGFVGFYIFWEIKSRYIYPIYPYLIILSYRGLKDIYDYFISKNFNRECEVNSN
jgi:hypothetical protein